MKNKIIILLLTICLVITYMPVTTFATNDFVNNNEQEENVVLTDSEQEESDLEENADLENTKSQIENVLNSEIEFSSKRLIVKGLKEELKDEPVIASLDGVYLLQYEDSVSAIEAYTRLSEISDSVEFDKSMYVASNLDILEMTEDGDLYEEDPMTEEENPFVEVEDINIDKIHYDVAVIDTGATDADKVVSVLGDSGQDNNGHGQKMINTIKKYAPDAKVLSIKAIGDDGVGSVSSVYAAIKLAMDEKVDVINLSISALATEDNFIIEEIIKEAQSQGITVVGAAGNNSMDASLTIPGKVEEATIVGTTSVESNTGDTIDYYISTTSTSVATAVVTGLIVSDTLKNYDVNDKVIQIELDEDTPTTPNPEDPTEDFVPQSEGSASAGGPPSGGGGTGPSTYVKGVACVWYDHNGKSQGWLRYNPKTKKYAWQRPTGASYQDESNYSSAKKACAWFWLNKLSPIIKERTERVYSLSGKNWNGYRPKWGNQTERYAAFQDVLEDACKKAIKRQKSVDENGYKGARIIGVAITYYSAVGKVNCGYSIGTIGKGKRDFLDMFYRHGYCDDDDNELDYKVKWPTQDSSEKEHFYSRKAGSLEEKGYIDTNIPSSWEDEQYRDYVWKYIGARENPDSKIPNKNGSGWRIIAIALNEDEPGETPVYLKFEKEYDAEDELLRAISNSRLYSVEGIKFKIYKTKSDAKNDTNVVATFTTDEQGKTESKKVDKNKTYYVTETVPSSSGLLVPDALKAENGGYKISVGTKNKTIKIGDKSGPKIYSVTYRYEMDDDSAVPSAISATLPHDSDLYCKDDIVLAEDPSETEITIGDDIYEFMGWDDFEIAISDTDPNVFTGVWRKVTDLEYIDGSDDGETGYTITTEVVNGTITESFLYDPSIYDDDEDTTDYRTVNYSPNPDCILDKVIVDGVEVSINDYPSSYTFPEISSNHTIRVEYLTP